MKTIQKLTLGLLTVVAASSLSASTLILDVETLNNSADVTGSLSAGTVHKIGAGIANVSGAVSAALELSAGQFNVSGSSSMPSAVTFDTTAGNILRVNDATVPLHGVAMTASGEVLLNVASLSWDTAPSGISTLTVDGLTSVRNLVVNADMSTATTPLDVQTLANLQVGGASHKATTGAHNIYGMLEILKSPAVGCVPGQTIIKNGGSLKVDASVSVPEYNNTGDLFGTGGADTLAFQSGAALILGDGAVWGRDIVVGTAS